MSTPSIEPESRAFLMSIVPAREAFRTLFEQYTFAQGWTAETIGGIFDRQGRRYIVFDVDATRQAARQRALPCSADLPPAKRRLEAVCAPGYTGRFGAEDFVLQEDGKLLCPAGASLWLSEVRQENEFTEAGPSTWLTRRIVSAVRGACSAWHQEPRGIEPVV